MTTRDEVLKAFAEKPQRSITDISRISGLEATVIAKELNEMRKEGIVDLVNRTTWTLLMPNLAASVSNPLVPSNIMYLDYAGVVSRLRAAYRMGLNALIIGPAGVGKTEAIRKVAELEGQPLRTNVFSLRTREHHVIGRLDTNPDGTLYYKTGPIIKSMLDGGIWYGDEINTAESDCLVRLDEALDSRRQVEIEGNIYAATKTFWAVGSINPLDRYHSGTKELPGQLLSRFPVRIYMEYPDASTEYNIIKLHVPDISKHSGTMLSIIELMSQMRDNVDLPYHPTIRESITCAKLLCDGMPVKQAIIMTVINVYGQWGKHVMEEVAQLANSRMDLNISIAADIYGCAKTIYVR